MRLYGRPSCLMLFAFAASGCGQFEACHGQSDCDPASARAIEQVIHRNGAAAAAASLSNAEWDIALDEATDGRADRIDAIAWLRKATDGARNETIGGALSDALLGNPAKVLKLLATRTELASILRFARIAPSSQPRRNIATALAAVGHVSNPRLRGVRARCLASLKKAPA